MYSLLGSGPHAWSPFAPTPLAFGAASSLASTVGREEEPDAEIVVGAGAEAGSILQIKLPTGTS